MPLRKTTQSGVSLIVLLNFSFLCGSQVSCICVERNTPFCYVYHFIYCVFHVYIIIAFAVCNGLQLPTVLRRRVHVAAQRRERRTCQVSKESNAVCS